MGKKKLGIAGQAVFGWLSAPCARCCLHSALVDGTHGQPPAAPTPQGYFYYIFGFAFLVAILTIIITVEVSIVCTYVQVGWVGWGGWVECLGLTVGDVRTAWQGGTGGGCRDPCGPACTGHHLHGPVNAAPPTPSPAAVRRGLPVVVALLLPRRLHRHLRPGLLHWLPGQHAAQVRGRGGVGQPGRWP